MSEDWDPDAMLMANICTISIAARQSFTGQCVCLIEHASGWAATLGGLVHSYGRPCPAGFSIGFGDELIRQIAAQSVIKNKKLHDQILKACPEDTVQILIFYQRDAALRIACCDIELSHLALS